jgi:hypothetical protein
VGAVHEPKLVKLICAVTFAEGEDLDKVLSRLAETFGAVDLQSPVFNFDFTTYYCSEMGERLKKCYVSFQGSIDPGTLAGIKRKANALEDRWRVGGKRRVNLDPGYVAGGKVVLASTKDYAHRIYIGEGMYGDNQLRFMQGRFLPSVWTYPDYQTDLAFSFFKKVRKQAVAEDKG